MVDQQTIDEIRRETVELLKWKYLGMGSPASDVWSARCKVLLDALDEAKKEKKYLEEHHVIAQSAIGLAKLALQKGHIDKAQHALVRACDQIDEITRRYCPQTTALAADEPKEEG